MENKFGLRGISRRSKTHDDENRQKSDRTGDNAASNI